MKLKEEHSNKAMQIDAVRAVSIVVSLSLHFTTMEAAHKLRVSWAFRL